MHSLKDYKASYSTHLESKKYDQIQGITVEMAAADKKLKLLLFGTVGDKIIPFATKIKALHKSKAGPFHLCFCVGSFHVPDEGTPEYEALKELPFPVYLQDALTTTMKSQEQESDEIRTILEPNVKAFPTTKSNVYNITVDSHPHVQLVVASCPRNLRMDDPSKPDGSIKPLMDKIAHVSYVGCDLLLTSHWPQGMEGLGDASVAAQARSSATYDVAEVALRARARYHVVPAATKQNTYWQSPPFFHLASTASTQTPQHTGRLVALGAVSAEKKVPKQNKFVHALGLVPLHAMDAQELQSSLGQGVAPCPFTDASYNKDRNTNGSGGTGHSMMQTNAGLSEAQARRLLAEGNQGGPERWNLPQNRKRSNRNDDQKQEPQEVDPANTTLFVHGLHKDVSGDLQSASNVTLLQHFQPFGVSKVRRPPNAATTSFAFLEFESHEQAKNCLETLGGETEVSGVRLTIKWGTHNDSNRQQGQQSGHSHKRPRLTEDEAKDSSTLYFRLPRSLPPNLTLEEACEHVRKWMEDTLETALSEEGNRISAAEEPALQVQVRHSDEQTFGFLDFASHAAASMALATLTGNTNGGVVQNPDKSDEAKETMEPSENTTEFDGVKKESVATTTYEGNEGATLDVDKAEEATKSDEAVPAGLLVKLWGLALHWAHAKKEKSEHGHTLIEDANCDFKFQRQHFPADSRKDCWFCLASEGCEKHLISGVYQQCYAAMPKGAMHKGHVLLIPVTHSSQGAFMNKAVSREIQDLQKALRQHAQEEYDMDLFVFERAIQTRGGYHTHVQCVPVPKGLGVRLESTLIAQAKANKIDIREIQSPDLDISTLLGQNEVDEDGGYFYAEVPMPGRQLEYKRFLYQMSPQNGEGTRGPKVPLQFGREVIAAVMGKSELAHWKSCQVDKEEETKMAADLRQSFEKYYHA